MKFTGLLPDEVKASREQYGSNELTQIPPDPLWKKILEGFKDPMIMILLVAMVVQFVLFLLGQAEWFEPVCILIAILIANGVASFSENAQEGKASELKAEELAKELTKVVRDGEVREIHVNDIVVGDIVYLQAGDKIPADGVMLDGVIKVDQAALNGETEEAEKKPLLDDRSFDKKDLLNPYYVYRGTIVCGGEGYFKVDVVGDNSLFGKLALEVQEEARETPLQVKLGKLAKQISTFGYVGAIAIIAAILLKTLITGNLPGTGYEWIRLILDAITVAVTIIVCAVPEGLPMLTSILMAFQSMKMAKDNVLVHKLAGLETAGSLTILFSDKTGTITNGKLTVSTIIKGDGEEMLDLNSLSESVLTDFIYGIGANNSASVEHAKQNEARVIGGNSTDRSLLQFLVNENLAQKIDKSKIFDVRPFDSTKKKASISINTDSGIVTYIKGAPEAIIDKCTFYLTDDGAEINMDNAVRANLDKVLNRQAERSMRLLAVAKVNDVSEEKNLTLLGVFCIRDNVRPDILETVKGINKAGIQIVMVTGDRKETAMAIAKEAGIITEKNNVVITSAEFNEMSDEEVKKILPALAVVARALPTDKSRLVAIAQSLDMVVGMTGDGVNDSPALKKSDVGFAMGSGTEVAKEAGDITILDDKLSSIKKAILYGRTMFKSIRKFLIFQLTVNVAAVLACFIGPMLGENVILTVIQLLIINLAMDTLAAIMFGSEPPLEEYMSEKPIPRQESIITKKMFTEIIISGLYITAICLSILFFPPIRNLFGAVDITYLKSAVFATFMIAITLNGFNARTEHINVFENIGRNKNFILITLLLLVIQFVFVTFGGEVLNVEPLSASSWLICFILGFLVIPIDIVRKIVIKKS